MNAPREFYYFCLAHLVLVSAATWWLIRSPWGRAFVALRENPIRALSLGVDTRRYTLMAFAIGAGLGGISGALYAPLVQFIDPTPFALGLSLNLLLMVVLGGSGYFFGPFLGAIVAVLLPEWLRFAQGYYLMGYAVLVMVLMAFWPSGLLGLADRLTPAFPARAGAAADRPRRRPSARARYERRPRSARPEQELRRHRRGRRRLVRGRGRRNPRHHRPERQRQVDAVQLHPRPAAAERRATCTSTAAR